MVAARVYPLIMPLSALNESSSAYAGGKGAMLGELMARVGKLTCAEHTTIPEGIVLTSDAFGNWMQSAGVEDAKITAALNSVGKDVQKLEEVASLLVAKLRKVAVPESIRAEIEQQLPADKLWAVRSSGVGEDGGGSSFAGQHDTILNTEKGGINDAIVKVWLSAFNARAMYYRVTRDLTALPIRQAVVIQEMVPAEVAGVAFSIDPRTGVPGHGLVEYVSGLGDKLVSGEATPKMIPFKYGEDVPNIYHKAVGSVAKTVVELATLFDWPVDMEWAWANDKLYLLQARPITALPKPLTADQAEAMSIMHEKWGSPWIKGEPLSSGECKAIGFITRAQALAAMADIGKPELEQKSRYLLAERVLLAPFTTPDDLPIMEQVRGIVVTKGGATSHAAIVCREMAKPCVKIKSMMLAGHPAGVDEWHVRPLVMDGDGGGIYKLAQRYEVYEKE